MDFIIASNNPHKLKEMSRILCELNIKAHSPREMGIDLGEVEENGATFAENALIKAESACRMSGLAAIADDSGLMIDALGGEPGVYSARYGGEDMSYPDKYKLIWSKLSEVDEKDRTAHFVSAICVYLPGGHTLSVEGRCSGYIGSQARGGNGFGYDPIFVTEDGRTFAELSDDEKDAVSHRGRALEKLSDSLPGFLKEYGEK